MKVGEYIRTKDGIIDKVIIEYNGKCANPTCNCKHVSCEKNYYDEDKIIKSSPNIIDLIQVSDYVNGHKISLIYNNVLYTDEYTFDNIEGEFDRISFKYDEIKSIVTKE